MNKKSKTNEENSMYKFQKLFGKSSSVVIGMIHIQALPGTPSHKLSINDIIDRSLTEAKIYVDAGVDAILLENMHDTPYMNYLLHEVTPEIIASMSVVCAAVRHAVPKNIPLGIQILAGGNKAAIAVAKASSLQFIRAEGFLYSHIADEGMMNSCAGELLRYRSYIGADDILVFADIKKKHSAHSITSDVSIKETAEAALFFRADGVIITGKATGDPVDHTEILQVLNSLDQKLPILIGSGVTLNNIQNYINLNGIIVGSSLKSDGIWSNDVSSERTKKFMKYVSSLK